MAVLIGIIVALVAGILARSGGDAPPTAITKGGVAFAGAVTVTLLIIGSLGLL
ncbi:hypothetical protein ACFQ08_15360 [Streptosporangium algeriense]|uniref:Uncharacterized protein n=1 Tax=Streptosporangium algeriense TaxID=1682748 RepID=A0ABW3DPX4_9ACTN